MFSVNRLISKISLPFQLWQYKRANRDVQLHALELYLICKSLMKFKACNFLVFGMGYDSIFWEKVNRGGRTVFLESNAEWFDEIVKKAPHLNANLVSYPHNITQWQQLLLHPEKLMLELPDKIVKTQWDVILVDGPPGFENDECLPGRMSAIYTAAKIVTNNGHVIVHDCERQVEQVYTDRFLGEENLIGKIFGRALLKVYEIKKNDSCLFIP